MVGMDMNIKLKTLSERSSDRVFLPGKAKFQAYLAIKRRKIFVGQAIDIHFIDKAVATFQCEPAPFKNIRFEAAWGLHDENPVIVSSFDQ